MARINIEDSLYKDNRFYKLSAKVGGLKMALGELVVAWTLAQEWFLKGSHTIPFSEWKRQDLTDAIIEVGLADIVDGNVKMRGIETQFKWLKDCSEKGKRSALKRLKKVEYSCSTAVQPLPTSSSSSSSSSSSDSVSISKTRGDAVLKKTAASPDSGVFIAEYVKAFQKAYGCKARPQITGKVAGQVKNLLKTIPIDRACQLVQVYCQMKDPWFQTKCHDFGTFLENLNKIALAHDTGQEQGRKKSRPIEELLAEEKAKNELNRIQ